MAEGFRKERDESMDVLPTPKIKLKLPVPDEESIGGKLKLTIKIPSKETDEADSRRQRSALFMSNNTPIPPVMPFYTPQPYYGYGYYTYDPNTGAPIPMSAPYGMQYPQYMMPTPGMAAVPPGTPSPALTTMYDDATDRADMNDIDDAFPPMIRHFDIRTTDGDRIFSFRPTETTHAHSITVPSDTHTLCVSSKLAPNGSESSSSSHSLYASIQVQSATANTRKIYPMLPSQHPNSNKVGSNKVDSSKADSSKADSSKADSSKVEVERNAKQENKRSSEKEKEKKKQSMRYEVRLAPGVNCLEMACMGMLKDGGETSVQQVFRIVVVRL